MRWGLAMAGLVLVGCGEGEVGGGGIEIPNGLHLTVTSGDNQAVPSARVRLVARDAWSSQWAAGRSEVLDSGTTDQEGKVSLRAPEGEGCYVEVVHQGEGARLEVAGAGAHTVPLAPLSSIRGSLNSPERAGVAVALWGSSRTAYTDSEGNFRFDSVPQAQWSLVGRGASRRIAPLARIDLGRQMATLPPVGLVDSLLVLDDFSDSNSLWSMANLFSQGGFWWMDAQKGVRQVFGLDGAWQAVARDSAGPFYLRVAPDSVAMGGQWANAGLNLGAAAGVLPDFARAKSIRLRVRGRGAWQLLVAERSGERTPSWSAPLTVSDRWVDLVVPLSVLSGEGSFGSGATRQIREIAFQTTTGGRLDIAYLAVEGLALSDWKP